MKTNVLDKLRTLSDIIREKSLEWIEYLVHIFTTQKNGCRHLCEEYYMKRESMEEDYIKELTQIYVHEGDFCQPDKNGIWEGKVPEDHFFVLGDNRVVSKDSRAIGYISKNQIVGEAVFRVFPMNSDKFGFLN